MLNPKQLGEFLQTLHNPRYVDPEHRGPILFYGIIGGEKIPFFASPNDPMEYGRDIYKKAIEGHYGPIAESQPDDPPLPYLQKSGT